MDVLLAYLFIFVVLPVLFLFWMPGWKSLGAATIFLSFLLAWLWIETLLARPSYQLGAGIWEWMLGGFTFAVLAGACAKTIWMNRRS